MPVSTRCPVAAKETCQSVPSEYEATTPLIPKIACPLRNVRWWEDFRGDFIQCPPNEELLRRSRVILHGVEPAVPEKQKTPNLHWKETNFHPEIQSGCRAVFHLVFHQKNFFSFPEVLRDSLSGIGAEPEQTDDVSHGFSQVLPEAMRVLPFKNKQTKKKQITTWDCSHFKPFHL